jgi:hypothetical protein
MITPLNTPRDIRVVADEHGSPAFVWFKGRKRQVARVRNMWRIDDEWWRQEISRCYFDLELSGGTVITTFQDLISGTWYWQRC